MDTNIGNSTTLLLCRHSNVKGEVFRHSPSHSALKENHTFYKPREDIVDICGIIKALKNSPLTKKS